MGFSLLFRRGFEAALENRSSAAISAAGFFDEGRVRSEVSGHETRCAKRGHTRLFEYCKFRFFSVQSDNKMKGSIQYVRTLCKGRGS